jgi:hypothetical protein
MIKKSWILAPMIAALIAGCAAQKKIVVKSAGEEIAMLGQMTTGVSNRDWNGPMIRLKEVIIDQLERAQAGMKTRRITEPQGAEIISKAAEVIEKADDMAQNSTAHAKGQGGSHKGGGGGMGMGGGRHHHDDLSSGSSEGDNDSGSHGQLKEFVELKDMITGYYGSTPTASDTANYVTGTVAPINIVNPPKQEDLGGN